MAGENEEPDEGEELDVTDESTDVEESEDKETEDKSKDDDKAKPKPKPKAAEKPKAKPKPKAKATVTATELDSLRRKAQAYDAEETKRTQADERKQREREIELAKTDPVKAVETVRKRLETSLKSKDTQISELTKRVNDLTGRLHSGVLDTGLKEAIASAAKDAKLQLKDGAVPFILKDLRDRFEVDEDGETGEYFIFEKETNREVSEVVTDMFMGSYKDFFANQVETAPSGGSGGNRRPSNSGGGGGKTPTKSYASSFKRMVDAQNREGHKPSIGLTRPKAS
jgi:molecular chaperone GrpE (heat shock protein)